MHEEGLRSRTEKRQKRAKRQTQLRLIARRKLKDSKALHQLPAFSGLNDEEVNSLIDKMDHITRFKNDSVCHQHDASESFYIIVKGSAVATVDDESESETEKDKDKDNETSKCRTVATTCPKQIEVGRIEVLGFFGEGSLVKEGDGTCSATVSVSSDRCELLRLSRKKFVEMNIHNSSTFQEQKNEGKSVLEQLRAVKMERVQSNRALLERRTSSKKLTTSSSSAVKAREEELKDVTKGGDEYSAAAGKGPVENEEAVHVLDGGEEDTSVTVSVVNSNGGSECGSGGEEGERKVVGNESEDDDDGNSNLEHFLKFGW